jgi:glycine hydroxymethyltransferase
VGDMAGEPLASLDPELASLISGELGRQRATLDLVASESVPPRAVLEAQGSILTAKYADGYPGRREYDTCEWIDRIETLAIERAKAVFGAEHANVQPYSGSSANAAVLHALCRPGDTILGWDFNQGGHPTHYSDETFAGRFYRGVCYGLRESDRLVDMEQVAALAAEHHPRVLTVGWSCYQRTLDFAEFRRIADSVGAYLHVDMAHFAGLVAAGVYPNPVPYADVLTMTVHKTLSGARAGAILCRSALASRIDDGVFPGQQGCPLPHVMAGAAVTFLVAGSEEFRERTARVVEGARTMAAVLDSRSEEIGASVVTGGTETHQFLLDLAPSGRDATEVMAYLNRIGVSGNAMRIAYDAREAPGTSGLRFGTTALAGRGAGPAEFEAAAGILADALADGGGARADELGGRISALLGALPLYPYLA